MLVTGLAFFGALSLATFMLPFLMLAFIWRPQNLKKKYKCEWALVTGSSSGIGKVLTEKLCAQGLNVVMVALDDKLLDESHKEIVSKFPDVEVRKCGCDLSKDGYMEPIKKCTDDINVALVFNNAGYITTGMFADVAIERHMANYECNATCALRITHHFLNKMLDSGTKGLIAFTSSPAGAMCSPFASIYGSTKAFLTEFAMSLAPEVKFNGVDVVVVHPSPVASNFYNSVHKISSIQMFQNTARGPENIGM
jgi:short-subunit dehydrogenase